MNWMKQLTMMTAALVVAAMPASAAQDGTTTITTARGGSLTRTRTSGDRQATVNTVVTTAAGRTATLATSIDANRSDGRVGVTQTAIGPEGRSAVRSRSTSRQDGAIVHEAHRTGFDGVSVSKQGVYTRDGSSHVRTGRAGRTRSWSRSR